MSAAVELGPFELRERIGRGGMGEVWGGVHRAQGVPVAVKVLTAERAREPVYLRRFRHEVRAMARLYHPGIVTVLDYGEIPADAAGLPGSLLAGSPYLVMERVEHGSLSRVGVVDHWPTMRRVLLALLDALAHAHARGVIHRDLKPDNVLIAAGEPGVAFKLTDFGIAHAAGADAPQITAGTPPYMAPEQIRGDVRDQGPWTDLYALGCLAYRLACGLPPYRGSDREVLRAQLAATAPPLPTADKFPRAFSAWLQRLLAKQPALRFQRAADAAFHLHRIGGGEAGDETALRALSATDKPERVVLQRLLRSDTADMRGARVSITRATLTLPVVSWRDAAHARADGDLPAQTRTGDTSDLFRALDEAPPIPRTWRIRTAGHPPAPLGGAGLGLFGLRPAPFVDRRRERDALWDALRAAREHGGARAVLVRGGAGTGKTRLVEWICHRAHEVGAATVLSATHSPIAGASDGVAGMFADYLGTVGLSQDEVIARVRWVLAERIGIGADDHTARAVAALAGSAFHGPPAEPDTAPPPARPRESAVTFSGPGERFAVAYRLIAAIAGERPVILVIDDAQWGGDSLGFALHVLAAQAREPQPVVVIAIARSDEAAPGSSAALALAELAGHPACTTVSLGPLAPADHSRMIRQLLRMEQALSRAVEVRTQGNPLFAVQLIGDWVERGVLTPGPRGFQLVEGERAALPADIHDLWAGHTDRVVGALDVSGDARRALEIAAALGRDVDVAEWQHGCAIAGVRIPDNMVEALMAGRLARPGAGWAFAHGMLRESVERSADDAGRLADHHRACAQMLAERYDAAAQGVAERRAEHLLAAGERSAALAPLLAAAFERTTTSDFARAYELLDARDRALVALGVPEGEPQWIEGWSCRARALGKQGDVAACATYIARCEAAVLAVLDGANSRGGADACEAGAVDANAADAETANAGSSDPANADVADAGTSDAGTSDADAGTSDEAHPLRLRARVWWLRGLLANKRGHVRDGVAAFERALALYRRLGDRRGEAETLYGMGEICKLQGDLAAAVTCYESAIESYRAAGDTSSLGMALSGLSDTHRRIGDYELALRLNTEALEALRAAGNVHSLAVAINDRGDVHRGLGQLPDAETHYREAIALFSALGSRDRAITQMNLAAVRLAREDYAGAEHELADARGTLESQSRLGYLAFIHGMLLPCVAARGDWDAVDENCAALEHQLAETRLRDEDLAGPLEQAGALLEAAAQRSRATRAFRLAAEQWRALGRESRAVLLETRASELDTADPDGSRG